MKSYQIEEIKSFMAKLFGGVIFNDFFLVKAQIRTICSYVIEGKSIEEKRIEDESIKEKQPYVYWEQIEPIVFQIIKGKKSPSLLQLVLEPGDEWISKHWNQVGGLKFSLTIRFEQKQGETKLEDSLLVTAGVSGNDFLLAHQLQEEWAGVVRQYLKENGIVCYEI